MKYMDLVKLVKGTHGVAHIIKHRHSGQTVFATVQFRSEDWSEDPNLDNLLDSLFKDCLGYQFIKDGWAFDCGRLGVYLLEDTSEG